jgi:dipeptidyl-peptidase-4
MISVCEVRTGRRHDVISFDKLNDAAVRPPAQTTFEWTDRRVGEKPIQWFSDNRHLLVSATGDLFIVDAAKGSFEPLTQTPEIEHDPRLSPDNQYVSFRRASDLYTLEIATKHLTRLTKDGSDTVLNGELDWVYPEELELGTAHWWSPDSKSIAYLQFDVTHEPVFPQVSLLSTHAVFEPERFPQPGTPNADVRLGVVPARGGDTKWMNLGDTRDFLLARVVWAPSSREILAETLNRIQNRLDLMLADAASGAARSILHEQDPYWINVKGEPVFLPSGDRFLWTSERSGFRHLYLCAIAGGDPKQLTSGEWEVDELGGVDSASRRILFTSSEAGPTERRIYSVALDGSDKRPLSRDAGWHTLSLAPNGSAYLDRWSSLAEPPRTELHSVAEPGMRMLFPPDRGPSEEYNILPTEIVKVKAKDGTPLFARMIRPAGFDPAKKYPAVVMVYGGPGVQMVRNAWSGLTWDQVLAARGFVIWQLDNRGSIGRGHAFESVIHHNTGEHELADQKEGISWLVAQGFVDPKRIGLYGWSYGGYMTLYTVTHAPGLIRAAISGAPVTSWRNYDSIYTERYMGLPDSNPEGYRTSSPISSAAALDGTKLLIIHNFEDDNVHFQNTLQMADALEKAGKKFSMLVYPQKAHGVSGPVQRQLLESTTAFFEENLR